MRVVFDTNIFISALMIPGSQGEKAVARILEERDELVISRDIIQEVLPSFPRSSAAKEKPSAMWP